MTGGFQSFGGQLNQSFDQVVIGDHLMHWAKPFHGMDFTITALIGFLPNLNDDVAIFRGQHETADADISFSGAGIFSDSGHTVKAMSKNKDAAPNQKGGIHFFRFNKPGATQEGV
jgi:hypothetical protein